MYKRQPLFIPWIVNVEVEEAAAEPFSHRLSRLRRRGKDDGALIAVGPRRLYKGYRRLYLADGNGVRPEGTRAAEPDEFLRGYLSLAFVVALGVLRLQPVLRQGEKGVYRELVETAQQRQLGHPRLEYLVYVDHADRFSVLYHDEGGYLPLFDNADRLDGEPFRSDDARVLRHRAGDGEFEPLKSLFFDEARCV